MLLGGILGPSPKGPKDPIIRIGFLCYYKGYHKDVLFEDRFPKGPKDSIIRYSVLG